MRRGRSGWLAERGEPAPAPGQDSLEVVFRRDYSVDDGRCTNNGWLQEMPDPITKLTWDNVDHPEPQDRQATWRLLENPRARASCCARGGKLELDGRTIEGPVWVQPGQADYTVGLGVGLRPDSATGA